jgi:hypothetical protein
VRPRPKPITPKKKKKKKKKREREKKGCRQHLLGDLGIKMQKRLPREVLGSITSALMSLNIRTGAEVFKSIPNPQLLPEVTL